MALSSIFGRRGSVWDAPDHFTWFPSVDWRETAKAHVIEADVPGLRKEDVQVQVEEGRTLSIAGERRNEEENATEDSWHRVERSRGAFLRRFRLPENVNLDRIAAKVEHGVLAVVVPKLEEKKESQVRKIHVASKL